MGANPETRFQHISEPRFPGLAGIYEHFLNEGGTQQQVDTMSAQFCVFFSDLYDGLSLNEGGKKTDPTRYASLGEPTRNLSAQMGMIYSEKQGRMRNHLLHLEPGMIGQMAYTYYVGYDSTPIPIILPRGMTKGMIADNGDYRPGLTKWIATANSDQQGGLDLFEVNELAHLGERICSSYALRIKQAFISEGITKPNRIARSSEHFAPGSFAAPAFIRYAWKNIADTMGQGSLYEPDHRVMLA